MDQELLYKYLRGETSETEEQRILEWLDADPEKNSKELNAVRFLYFALESCEPSVKELPAQRVFTGRNLLIYATGLAAAFLLIVGGRYLGKETQLNEISNRMASVEVPFGQRIKMTLEDGSTVWLNAGTKIEYPMVFGRGARRVKLSGEALFEVSHEQKRPFIVETFASEVEVLGTKFNVLADEQMGVFSTSLIDGSVKVVNLRNNESLLMKPNDVVNLVNGRLVLDKINDPVSLQWSEGLLSLKGQTFPELMRKFEKAYGVKIIIERKTPPELTIKSGKIWVSDGIDHALRVLQLASDFQYTKDPENNGIIIQ